MSGWAISIITAWLGGMSGPCQGNGCTGCVGTHGGATRPPSALVTGAPAGTVGSVEEGSNDEGAVDANAAALGKGDDTMVCTADNPSLMTSAVPDTTDLLSPAATYTVFPVITATNCTKGLIKSLSFWVSTAIKANTFNPNAANNTMIKNHVPHPHENTDHEDTVDVTALADATSEEEEGEEEEDEGLEDVHVLGPDVDAGGATHDEAVSRASSQSSLYFGTNRVFMANTNATTKAKAKAKKENDDENKNENKSKKQDNKKGNETIPTSQEKRNQGTYGSPQRPSLTRSVFCQGTNEGTITRFAKDNSLKVH